MSGSKEECERWAQAADTYDAEYRSAVGEGLENQIRSWLARQFTDADNVLELGCGTGIFSAMIAERVKHLTATDFSPEMLERAQQRLGGYANVEVQREDARHTSFADDSFGAVLAVNLLHHAQTPASVVQECRRVVAPGGKVVVIERAGHGGSFLSWIRMSFRYLCGRGRSSEEDHHFSPDDLVALIADAGLAVREPILIGQGRPRMGFICLCATNVAA